LSAERPISPYSRITAVSGPVPRVSQADIGWHSPAIVGVGADGPFLLVHVHVSADAQSSLPSASTM
jgi:hypothetical protein